MSTSNTDWQAKVAEIRSGGGEAPLEKWLSLLQARRDAAALPATVDTATSFSLSIELVIAIATRDRKMGRRFEEILHALTDRKLRSRRASATRKLTKALREHGEPSAARMLEQSPEEFLSLFERGRSRTPVARAQLFEALLVD